MQQGCFSAAVNNKVCKFKGGKSMAFEAYKIEEIVEAFEKGNVFLKLGSSWDDTKLFILIDSVDMSHLFEIIDGFEIKNKVAECKNFSFQIKIEEDPVNLESGIASFLDEGGESAAASVEIDKLNKEIERKNAENNELKNEIVKKDNEINNLNEQIKKLQDEIAPKDKEIEEWKKWYDDWDRFAVGNIISDGKGHIKLKKPIDTIHEIYIFSEEPIEYSKAELHLKELKDNWHFPTEEESLILLELYKIPQYDDAIFYNLFTSLFFNNTWEWFIDDGKIFSCIADADSFGFVTDKKRIIHKAGEYERGSVIFVR